LSNSSASAHADGSVSSRLRASRFIAAIVALGLVGASTLIAAPAHASLPLVATLDVQASSWTPGIFDDVTVIVTVTGTQGSCAMSPPTVAWEDTDGGFGFLSSPSINGDVLTYTITYEAFGNGRELGFTANTSGICTGWSQLSESVELTSPWYQGYAYGYTLAGREDSVLWNDSDPVVGVRVDLIEASDGPDGEPVATTESNADGNYTIFAPLFEDADIERTYVLRFMYPGDGPVIYYNGMGSPWSTSNTVWDDATIFGPLTWQNTTYSVYLAPDTDTGEGEGEGEECDPMSSDPEVVNVPIEGGCTEVAGWPEYTLPFRVGVSYDYTFNPVGDGWDWSNGGNVEAESLPAGLTYETVDGGVPSHTPGLRIYGTPTTAGPYAMSFQATDGTTSAARETTGTVLPAEQPLTWNPALGDLTVGTEIDVSLEQDADDRWDFAHGENVYVAGELPAGLEYELVWDGQHTPPIFHFYGAPTEAGPYEFTIVLSDMFGTEVAGHFTGTVLATLVPVTEPGTHKDATISLSVAPGKQLVGATATVQAEGLLPDTDYSFIVRSTPTLLAAGTSGPAGDVATTATIPGGLETGWHSLTFSSTWYDGTAFNRVLWFELDASGILLRVSDTEPAALAYTGSAAAPDSSGTILLAVLAMMVGLVLMVIRRRRTQNA
jgi:hypothetical protein